MERVFESCLNAHVFGFLFSRSTSFIGLLCGIGSVTWHAKNCLQKQVNQKDRGYKLLALILSSLTLGVSANLFIQGRRGTVKQVTKLSESLGCNSWITFTGVFGAVSSCLVNATLE